MKSEMWTGSSGNKYWNLPNGKLKYNNYHREDGPAVIYNDGQVEWWYRGKQINCSTQEEFERILKMKAFW